MAASSVWKEDQLAYLLDALQEKKWIELKRWKNSNNTVSFEIHITPEGYAHLEELRAINPTSDQAFVAMWFDDSMSDIYDQAIAPGIEDAGYRTLRIDRKEHNNKIDDQIISEIRRSRFIVADFTSEKDNAHGGVYYEAGYAHGLNIPVIFTCRKDCLDTIHFDTRQFNHITWEKKKLEEFRKELKNRITVAVGDGPNYGKVK